jgi:hypothetical protein
MYPETPSDSVSRGDFFSSTKPHLSRPKKVPFTVLMCKVSGWLAHQKKGINNAIGVKSYNPLFQMVFLLYGI